MRYLFSANGYDYYEQDYKFYKSKDDVITEVEIDSDESLSEYYR